MSVHYDLVCYSDEDDDAMVVVEEDAMDTADVDRRTARLRRIKIPLLP